MKRQFIKTTQYSLIALTFLFGAGNSAVHAQNTPEQSGQTEDQNVVEVINASTEHTMLAQLLAEAQLIETLSQSGPYTVLAPTDEAFYALGPDLQELRDNPQELQSVLLNHLFQGEVSAEQITEEIGLEIQNGDIKAENGVVHVIDLVIVRN